MIQTGHSNGAATPDEQEVIANVLFYLGQVTQETNASVRTAEDLTPPDKPTVKLVQKYGQNGVYSIQVNAKDKGTTYEHYVEGLNDVTNRKVISNLFTNR